jgi:hypothetical protein
LQIPYSDHATIEGDTQAYFQHQIHQGMHKHSPSFRPCLLPLGDGYFGMGKMQHFGW